MKKLNLNILKQPFVLILIGPPLVGKSTAIKEWKASFKGEFIVISRDAILLEAHGSDNYAQAYNTVNQKEVDKTLTATIEEASENGENVILDMTHLASKRRRQNLGYFGKEYTKIGVMFPVPKLEELFKRNEKRSKEENKFIREEVIASMYKSFQPIQDKEGFNKIISL